MVASLKGLSPYDCTCATAESLHAVREIPDGVVFIRMMTADHSQTRTRRT